MTKHDYFLKGKKVAETKAKFSEDHGESANLIATPHKQMIGKVRFWVQLNFQALHTFLSCSSNNIQAESIPVLEYVYIDYVNINMSYFNTNR